MKLKNQRKKPLKSTGKQRWLLTNALNLLRDLMKTVAAQKQIPKLEKKRKKRVGKKKFEKRKRDPSEPKISTSSSSRIKPVLAKLTNYFT